MNGTRSHRRRKRGRRTRRKDTNAKVACNYVHATEITRLEPWSPCFSYLRDLRLREMLPPWIDGLVVAKIQTIWKPTRWRFSLKCSFLDFLEFLARSRVCICLQFCVLFSLSLLFAMQIYTYVLLCTYLFVCSSLYDTCVYLTVQRLIQCE